MLDPKALFGDFDKIKKRLATRGTPFDFGTLLEADKKRRQLQQQYDYLRSRQSRAGEEISRLQREKLDASLIISEMKEVATSIKKISEERTTVEAEFNSLLLQIPNIPHQSVPVAKGPEGNVIVRQNGAIREFDFQPRHHSELGESLGIIDFERASRVSGSRFAFLVGLGARLERALIQLMLDIHTKERGYRELLPPYLVSKDSMTGTGQLPKFEDDLFRTTNGYYLIPTAEVPLVNYHRGEILDEERLPLSYAAWSGCFRSEAGSYGKDTRGLIRQHQFNKVELVKITTGDRSYGDLERLTADAEEVLKRLQLPYRVVTLCTGDLGFASSKTYDLEVWMPGEGEYREISSCSNCEDFQARRSGIRYRPKGGGKPLFAHTLNGSGVAVGRTLAAILENFQKIDGTVDLPTTLHPYMDGITEIR